MLVVGAGPAGAAAALHAHDRGLSVGAVDKATFPRDKICGDGLTTAGLRLLERLGVDVTRVTSYAGVRETVLVGPSGRQVRFPIPTDGEHVAVVPRAELDGALVEQVRARGIPLMEGRAVATVTPRGTHVEVGLDDGVTLSARHVIAADGHYSTVRKLVAPHRPQLGTWHAFRAYYHDVADDRLWVLFERDLLPGYAWVFPLPDGRANVGFGVLRGASSRGRRGRHLASLARDVFDRPSVRAVLGPAAKADGPPRAWPIPSSFHPTRLHAGRVLFAGDAAGVVDPMTGEGIAQALETGILAADAIADAPLSPAGAYERAVREGLAPDLRFARALQRVLATRIGCDAALALTDLTPWTRRNFARWMFEGYPRAVLLTPSRWERGVFTRPGAYATRRGMTAASPG